MVQRIRVFHVEDYRIMRDGLRHLLERDPDIQIVGEADSGAQLIEKLSTTEVDVIIMDIYLDQLEIMPNTKNGIQLCQHIQEKYPAISVIIHSTYDDAERVSAALTAGAKGFVSKRAGFDELLRAVHAVADGKRYICTETSERLRNLNGFLLGVEDQLRNKSELFTVREREVLTLLAEGQSSKQIAETLSITERTVESHRKNMMEKSHTKNTAELVAHASTLGLLKK